MQVNPTTAHPCAFNETTRDQEALALLKLGLPKNPRWESQPFPNPALTNTLLIAPVKRQPYQTLSKTEQQAIQGLIDFIQHSKPEVQA
ncbi:MAG: hypothetical protein E6Q85_01740 [Thiothrix sp.]|nr:MAG: hypothetical protein E6Q85_01740 [Thiothrix sp.]